FLRGDERSSSIDHGRFEVLDFRKIGIIWIGDLDRFDAFDRFPIFAPMDRNGFHRTRLKRMWDANPSLFAENIHSIDSRSEKAAVDLGDEIILENERAGEKFVVSNRIEL